MIETSSILKSAAVATVLVGTAAPSFAQNLSRAEQTIPSPGYKQEIELWRTVREERLRSDVRSLTGDGWLLVAGLYWLKQGDNWAGSLSSHPVRYGKVPETLGSFRLDGQSVRFFPVTSLPLKITRADGSVANPLLDTAHILAVSDDNDSEPDRIEIGDVVLYVIKRGDRFAVRLKDKSSFALQSFKGCSWFPVKPEYRINARFVAYPVPKIISVQTVVGTTEKQESPGYVEFTVGGKKCTLEAQTVGNRLFFNFQDKTNGAKKKATYPGGRFLYADKPQNGIVVLDFNKAYNPPCAFTPFATCPLPPRVNRLQAAIEAGELEHHPAEESGSHRNSDTSSSR